jgi:hypothetical protein
VSEQRRLRAGGADEYPICHVSYPLGWRLRCAKFCNDLQFVLELLWPMHLRACTEKTTTFPAALVVACRYRR